MVDDCAVCHIIKFDKRTKSPRIFFIQSGRLVDIKFSYFSQGSANGKEMIACAERFM